MNSDAQLKASKSPMLKAKLLPIRNTLIQPIARNSTFAWMVLKSVH